MGIMAGSGNLTYKISFHLLVSSPWVKRNAAIMCLKSRDYSDSSSLPIRYIPKHKSSQPDNTTSSTNNIGNEFHKPRLLPLKNESQNRVFHGTLNGEASSSNAIYHDNNAQAAFSGLEEEIDNNMEVIQHESMEEPKEFTMREIQHERNNCKKSGQAGRTMQDAEKIAVELLATRAFTAVELRKKLLRKRFPPDVVEAVIINFQNRGLINDSLYAETFSRSRWSSSSWGPRRIKQALFMKGVSEADAEKAIKVVFKDEESGDQGSKLGMSKLSLEQLLVGASKQWLRGKDVPKETRKSRIIRWLQYRGFNWDVISFILKKLESQYSS